MLANNSWVKVWKIESHEKYTKIQCSTQRKVNGKYETDFSGFVTLVGDAHAKAVELSEKDSIKILSFGVNSSKSNGKYYTNVVVFDFEIKDAKVEEEEEEDDDLPFN